MTTPFDERQGLLFVGSSHPPNTDAIQFYASEIMPLLLQRLPGVKFYVVGANLDKKLKDIRSENIVFTGFVKNLSPYFEQCRVYIAPLRFGAGVKGKVIEAMSYGLPVVTTTIGAEGLGVTSGEQMLIADTREKIVESVYELNTNRDLWSKLSLTSRTFVEQRLSQDAFRSTIADMLL
jgi:glycosyltransferase involved in cell wall biosynthesis